ncbi:putative phage tail protein, partial [Merdimmobilis hominis]|uniref:putative phage tail protein n=1 Tax=Merdimmobilis hominis TaxID=2897707 RepID=UPI0032D379C5
MYWWDSKSDYGSLLPRLLEQIAETAALALAINPELDAVKGRLRQLIYNRFPQAADEEGIARWEKLLGVSSPLN